MVRRASNAGPFARLSPRRRIARLAMRRRSLRLYRASHIDPRGQCSRARKRGAGGTGSGLRGWLSCSCWSRSPGCAAPWWTRSARACGAELPSGSGSSSRSSDCRTPGSSPRILSRQCGSIRRVVQDVSEALTHQDVSIAYELSVLGTLIRHASILGCFLLGSPCLGRYEPVERVTNAWRLSSEISEGFPLLFARGEDLKRSGVHRNGAAPHSG